MTKLFNLKRKKLVSEKPSVTRTYNYLKYAIGEIVLVVIGILIAVSINNWNENRKDLIAETKILNDLKHEFLNNKTKFDETYKVKLDALTKLRTFIELMNSTNLSVLEIVEARKNTLGVWTYNPSNGIINSLITTGQINLIKNDSLKYLLTNWKDNLLDYQEEEISHLKWYNSSLEPGLRSLLPRIYNGNGKAEYLFHTQKQIKVLFMEAFQNMAFQNLMIQNERHLDRAVKEGNDLYLIMNTILRSLDNEIKKKNNND